ncbi:hypothetical protein QTP88_027256 [Uroleucon formosanum]
MPNGEQLLGVPKIKSGTGSKMSSAVYNYLEKWSLLDKLKAFVFDTTASNTGRLNEASTLLEQKLNRDIIYFALISVNDTLIFSIEIPITNGMRFMIYEVNLSMQLTQDQVIIIEAKSAYLASLYWCASEDGCISQHDMRMSHECPTDKSKTTLVTIYGNLEKNIEARCLDINQIRTEQLAVGANDQYVRLYDRRMIQSLSSFDVKYLSKHILVYEGNNAALNKFNNAL